MDKTMNPNIDTTAVDTKDRLLAMLNSADDKMQYLTLAEIVMNTISITQGMWVEAGYAYKAAEICRKISDQCFFYTRDYNHAMTLRRINTVRNQAEEMITRFSKLQDATYAS